LIRRRSPRRPIGGYRTSKSLHRRARRVRDERGVTCALPTSNHARATIESRENRLFMHAGTEASTGLTDDGVR
jgi:hypothetical protein